MPAWTILAMPTVLWRTPWRGLHFEHVSTAVTSQLDALSGDTVWTAANGSIALGFEWVQVMRTVVALADPMSIASNLSPVDADDSAVSESRRAMLLNRLVHEVPWQQVVAEHVRKSSRELGGGGSSSPRRRHAKPQAQPLMLSR